MLRTFTLVILLFSLAVVAHCQELGEAKTGILYKYEASGGVQLHLWGLGITGRYGKAMTGYKRRTYEFDFVSMKHPRELEWAPNQFNKFVFGKMNSTFFVRPGIGFHKKFTEKNGENGVELRYSLVVGPTFALLKPIYYAYRWNVGNQDIIRPELADEAVHISRIDRAYPFFERGIDETKVLPGIHVKYGLMFEFNPMKDNISLLEVGISADGFYKEVPIMVHTKNPWVFLSLYLNMQFGQKWNK